MLNYQRVTLPFRLHSSPNQTLQAQSAALDDGSESGSDAALRKFNDHFTPYSLCIDHTYIYIYQHIVYLHYIDK